MTLPLALVITSHNRREVTAACLERLARQIDPGFAVILVDDGSSDGTREMVRSRFPQTLLLEGNGNLWWTAATNLGVQEARARGAQAIMTLNDDTLPDPGFIAAMKAAAAARPGALIGALTVDHETGEPVYWGERVFWPTAAFRPLPRPGPGPARGLHPVTHFPGRGLFIPAPVFDAIGLFDERRFPHYAADYDFTHRAQRAGFPIFCAYDAPLASRVSASGGGALMRTRTVRHYLRHLTSRKDTGNLLVFFRYARRNCPARWLLPCLIAGTVRRLAGYPLRAGLERLRRRDA